MVRHTMEAARIIEQNSDSSGKYKGQIVTDCVLAKVTKQVKVTHHLRVKAKYGS